MKLYTEEQVIFIAKAIYTHDFDPAKTPEELVGELTPIEIPSDEEIEQESYYKVSDHTENPYASFKSGAKWMKEQIIGLNPNNIESPNK